MFISLSRPLYLGNDLRIQTNAFQRVHSRAYHAELNSAKKKFHVEEAYRRASDFARKVMLVFNEKFVGEDVD